MHKLNIFPRFNLPFQIERLFPIALIVAALAIPCLAQDERLPAALGENWRAVGPSRTLSTEQWNILHNADIYAEYGLQRLTNRIYADGKTRAVVEIFEMSHASGAYGLYTFNRGSLAPSRRELFKGKFLASVNNEHSTPPPDDLINAIRDLLVDDGEQLSSLPTHLPEQSRIADSEKYAAGPLALAKVKNFNHLTGLIDFTGGVEIATADYANGSGTMSLAIIEYHTPQSATDGYARMTKYLASLGEADKARRIVKRIGNYVAEAVNVENAEEAQQIFSRIKYTQKVYWTGRKYSDVPLEFRPPDQAAIEEATQTTLIVVRSLYWMVVMVAGSISLGVVLGGAFFYYRRYRRRKLGTDEFFSDAGDTVRLNLDDYLLQPDEPSIKQIGPGKKSRQ